MKGDFESRRTKNYVTMRMIRDLTMALLILGMAVILLLGDKFNLEAIQQLDPVLRYGFGGLCLIYGSFRLYRGIKRDY